MSCGSRRGIPLEWLGQESTERHRNIQSRSSLRRVSGSRDGGERSVSAPVKMTGSERTNRHARESPIISAGSELARVDGACHGCRRRYGTCPRRRRCKSIEEEANRQEGFAGCSSSLNCGINEGVFCINCKAKWAYSILCLQFRSNAHHGLGSGEHILYPYHQISTRLQIKQIGRAHV